MYHKFDRGNIAKRAALNKLMVNPLDVQIQGKEKRKTQFNETADKISEPSSPRATKCRNKGVVVTALVQIFSRPNANFGMDLS